MAGQRRGEPGGDPGRRGGSRGRLAALLLAAALSATGGCDGGVRVVGYGGRTGGTGGTGSGAGALVGVWRSVSSLGLSTGETVVFDVRWSFGAAGACSRTRIETLVSGNEGSETTETLRCTYTFSGSAVTVLFEGSSVPSRLSVAFSGGDLLLDGTRFTRIG